MKWNHLAAAAAIMAVSLLNGCASVQKTDRNTSDHAKAFAPLTDKAVVYIYRDELLGSAIKMPVKVDEVVAGQTGPKSFLQLALSPGHHTIASLSEKDAVLPIDVEAGKSYYVWQEVKMGVMVARSALHLVSTDVGQVGVRKCDLLHTDAPSLRMPTEANGTVVSPAKPMTSVPPADEPVAKSVEPVSPPLEPTAPVIAAVAAPTPAPADGGLAVFDERVNKQVFQAAQDIASRHQCDRLLHVRSVDNGNAHFYSACPGAQTPIEIACNGNHCEEAAPQG